MNSNDPDGTFQHTDAEEKFEAGKEHAVQAASDFKESAMLKAREVEATAKEKVGDAKQYVRRSVLDARDRCEAQTRDNPMKALLYAFGAGFVLGLFLRR